MSVRMMALVWELDLPKPEKFLLLALADHADDLGGGIFPAVRRLAWITGDSERTTQRLLRRLEDRGLAEAVKNRAGGRRPTEYFIDPRRGDKLAPLPLNPRQIVTPGVTQLRHPRGDTAMSPDPPINHHLKEDDDLQNPPGVAPRDPGESWASYLDRIGETNTETNTEDDEEAAQ